MTYIYLIYIYDFHNQRDQPVDRKILHLGHCILQVILHNLHRFLLVVALGQRAT